MKGVISILIATLSAASAGWGPFTFGGEFVVPQGGAIITVRLDFNAL